MDTGLGIETQTQKASGSAIQTSRPRVSTTARFFSTRNLSIAILGLVLVIALMRAEPKDIPKIVETVVGSEKFGVLGWFCAALILIVGVVMIKVLCHIYDKEIARVTAERDSLQDRLLKKFEH